MDASAPLVPLVHLVIASLLLAPPLAAREELELRHTRLALPGAPASILPVDLDRDGRRDLVVVVAYTEWTQESVSETTFDDDIETLVEMMTVIPALVDRRELWVYRGAGPGRYEPSGPPLALDPGVLSLEPGPAAEPLLALTDEGIAAVRLDAAGTPQLHPLLAARPVLAGSGTFVRNLGLLHDLDGDGDPDLLFPAADGPVVYLWADGAFAEPGIPIALPSWDQAADAAFEAATDGSLTRSYPLPELRDLDGDGLPELLYRRRGGGWDDPRLLRNLGSGHFGPPEDPTPEPEENEDDPPRFSLVHIGDLDGDSDAEWVTEESLEDPDAGMRQEIREAKEPPFRYRVHRRGEGLRPAEEPYTTFEATGYAFEMTSDDDEDLSLPGGFQDLDGDGRADLLTLTLDFSLFQAIRIMAAKTIDLGLDFHVWCQGKDGAFHAVEGLDLSGHFRLDLNDLALGNLAQFEGDFDGDGRADFLQMGRGERVTIHLGRAGCRYPPEPDLVLELEEAPRDLRQVKILDLDADGRSDLLIVQPEKRGAPELTPPVRLELYLSGAER